MYVRAGDPLLGMLSVIPSLLLFAVIIVPSSSAWMASFSRALFFPMRSGEAIAPTSRAEALRTQKRAEDALIEYIRLIRRFPDRFGLWATALEICWIDLADPERAARLLRSAGRVVESPALLNRIDYINEVHRARHEERYEEGPPSSPSSGVYLSAF